MWIPESLIIDFEDLNKALEELINNRVSFNSSIDNINGLKEELIKLIIRLPIMIFKMTIKNRWGNKQKEENDKKLRELESNIEK